MALYKLGDNVPAIDVSAFIAATPTIIGNVTLKKDTSPHIQVSIVMFKSLFECNSCRRD